MSSPAKSRWAAAPTEPKKAMQRHKESRLTPAVGLFAVSTASYFALTTPRRKEWVDILLDYSHHKRTQYSNPMFDKALRFVVRMIPK